MDEANYLISRVQSADIGDGSGVPNCDVRQTFHECHTFSLNPHLKYDALYKIKIDSVCDYLHDIVNTGHWSEVDHSVRQTFSAVSLIKAIILLKDPSLHHLTALQDALKSIDLGLLIGAPLPENPALLSDSAAYLSEQLCHVNPVSFELQIKSVLPISKRSRFESLCGNEVEIVSCPSLDQFNKKFFLPCVPVKLRDCIFHWPAVSKWTDVNYLVKIAGNRTVPVEVGSHYVDENWSQKLMTVAEFLENYFTENTDEIGYLAQHNLFDQITELKNDIRVPEYCALSRNYDAGDSDPDINAWFGPKGTVSPLHFDPKDNLLVQVFGEKQVLLFAPTDSNFLYPHEDKLLFNTSQIDPVNPNLEKFPEFAKTTIFKCLLRPTEILYIPQKWWHHVTALEKSFSVSFWWE